MSDHVGNKNIEIEFLPFSSHDSNHVNITLLIIIIATVRNINKHCVGIKYTIDMPTG